MLKSSAKNIAAASGDSKTVDIVVVLAAGLFFANIVMGSEERKEPLLAFAADVQTCPTGCEIMD